MLLVDMFMVICISISIRGINSSLIFTHVVFRHGDRTPLNDVSTKIVQFSDDDFYPYGFGNLNLRGKQRSYTMGESLLKRYRQFLGNTYHNNIVEAVSSEYERAQMTLQIVLAALFPPTKESIIKAGLLWQPVAYKYLDFNNDNILAVHKKCSKIYKNKSDSNKDRLKLYQFLAEQSGIEITTAVTAILLYNQLSVQHENKKSLPDWSKSIYPEPSKSIARRAMVDLFNEHLSSISGPLLHKILTDTQRVINGTLPNGRKIVLYSGHDINILGILRSIGLQDLNFIKYSAYVLVEVHKINSTYGVKMFLQNYESNEPRRLHIENCGWFCPINRFASLVGTIYKGEDYCM